MARQYYLNKNGEYVPASPGTRGEPGGYYTPNVSNPDAETLEFTFTKSKEDMPAVPSVSVPIPSGAPEVHIGSERPQNGEKFWYNPDEDPEDSNISLEEVVGQVVDNCVPDWAKQPEKPKYTAVEVGALPADTPIPEGVTDEQIQNAVGAYLTENPPSGGGEDVAGWKYICEATITAEDQVWRLIMDKDAEGNSFEYNELYLVVSNVAATSGSVGVIFLNTSVPFQNSYCAKVNNFFVTNTQGQSVTFIKNMSSNRAYCPWFYVISGRTNTVAVGRHSSGENVDYNKIRTFGLQTSGETVFLSGTFKLYGR